MAGVSLGFQAVVHLPMMKLKSIRSSWNVTNRLHPSQYLPTGRFKLLMSILATSLLAYRALEMPLKVP